MQFVLGCVGLGGLGLLGPLAVRFIETILMMDRLLLDKYEEELLSKKPMLRLYHGQRMRVRMSSLWLELDDDQKRTLGKRRLTVLGRTGERIDWLLDLLGQPSLLWTGAVSGAGIVGFTLGFRAWKALRAWSPLASTPIITAFDSVLVITALVSIFGSLPPVSKRAAASRAKYWDEFARRNSV